MALFDEIMAELKAKREQLQQMEDEYKRVDRETDIITANIKEAELQLLLSTADSVFKNRSAERIQKLQMEAEANELEKQSLKESLAAIKDAVQLLEKQGGAQ